MVTAGRGHIMLPQRTRQGCHLRKISPNIVQHLLIKPLPVQQLNAQVIADESIGKGHPGMQPKLLSSEAEVP